MFSYYIYGLTIASNYPITMLLPTRARYSQVKIIFLGQECATSRLTGHCDWQKTFDNGSETHRAQVWVADTGQGRYTRLHFSGLNEVNARESHDFTIDPTASQMWVTWTAPEQDMIAFLVGPVMAALQKLRGYTCLHASVVLIEDKCIAILGTSGSGKSTTAFGLCQQGHPILSDDLAVLMQQDTHFEVPFGYPRVRLLPKAAAHFLVPTEQLQRVFFEDKNAPDKYALDTLEQQTSPQKSSYPLAAIYVLAEREASLDRPFITPLPSKLGFTQVLQHTSVPHVANGVQRSKEFRMLGRVAERVPLRRVHRPDNLNAISDVCNAIVEDAKQLWK